MDSTVSNTAPTLTDPGGIVAAENQTAVVSLTASDADGDTLTYSLSGDDAALFAYRPRA